MEQVPWVRVGVSAAVATLLAVRGLRKQSLSSSGAVAAFVVGFLSLASSWRFGLVLIAFYGVSSWLTKVGSARKSQLEKGHKVGGQRDATQVLTNSALASALCLLHVWLYGMEGDDTEAAPPLRVALVFGIVAHYAVACGDTWASELGILAQRPPVLITSCFTRRVPPGTNGGVSVEGTAASIVGGLFVGVVATVVGHLSGGVALWAELVVLGCVCGFAGSMVDSLLGAVCQRTYFVREHERDVVRLDEDMSDAERRLAEKEGRCMGVDLLTNNGVNFASIAVVTAFAAWFGWWYSN
jgi:uncharacterized protein (TIGR00297 family)